MAAETVTRCDTDAGQEVRAGVIKTEPVGDPSGELGQREFFAFFFFFVLARGMPMIS